jgi:hypothetical protein
MQKPPAISPLKMQAAAICLRLCLDMQLMALLRSRHFEHRHLIVRMQRSFAQFIEFPFQQAEDCSPSTCVQFGIKQTAVTNDIPLANKRIQLIKFRVFALGEFHLLLFCVY